VDDPEGMVITTRDYLDHYSTGEVQEFLRYLFEKKTVLFLGYGLDEIEVLEYILRRGGGGFVSEGRIRRYMLQGFFNTEKGLYDLLRDYYKDSFATELIPFPKDHKEYAQQTEILAAWSKTLRFGGMALADEVAAMYEEIRG
jgi:hypothetical protein